MLLAYHPTLVDSLRRPTVECPLRVLVSGCLAAWSCGAFGTDYGWARPPGAGSPCPGYKRCPSAPSSMARDAAHDAGHPRRRWVDVIAGHAKVFDEHGAELTEPMMSGARAMLAYALQERARARHFDRT